MEENVQETYQKGFAREEKPSFQRGRGRGKFRGKTSSRGRGSRPTQQPALPHSQAPTFQERYLQVRALEGAPAPVPSKPPPSIKELSAMMDQYYPTDLSYEQPPASVLLDPKGFVDVCCSTYNQIIARKSKLAGVLSITEFVISCSWLLVKRVLSIDRMLFARHILDSEHVLSSLPDQMDLPSPISIALESVGIVKMPTGEIVAPELILPRMDPINPNHAGMLPSIYLNGYVGVEDLNYMQYMLPFGLWGRRLRNESLNAAPNNAFVWTRLDPVGAHANDGYLGFPALLPQFQLQASASRTPNMANLQFGIDGAFSRAIFYSPQIFSQFQLFCTLATKQISMSPIPRGTGGTAAMLAYASPRNGDANNAPTNFVYRTGYVLDKNEQHAARLLRWRTRATRPQNQIQINNVAIDGNLLFARSPVTLQQGTMSLEDIDGYPSYLNMFTGAFCH